MEEEEEEGEAEEGEEEGDENSIGAVNLIAAGREGSESRSGSEPELNQNSKRLHQSQSAWRLSRGILVRQVKQTNGSNQNSASSRQQGSSNGDSSSRQTRGDGEQSSQTNLGVSR